MLVTYKQEQDAISGLGRLFNPRGLPMVHTDHYFVPNITRVDYMWGEHGFVINSQVTPIGPTDSLVYTAISFRLPFEVPGGWWAGRCAPVIKWYTTQVILQDVEIMRVQREGCSTARAAASSRAPRRTCSTRTSRPTGGGCARAARARARATRSGTSSSGSEKAKGPEREPRALQTGAR